ncbi:MAG TPA: hypothetical protein VNI01_12325 [Elusimicrobiota bacterium]|jgi:Tfp pilus assembly protein PilV|nr:hypothetical protein [Elusimicrobiota bacterium]
MTRAFRSPSRGATLVETLAAVLLLSIAVSSLMAAMLSLPRNQMATQNWERATFCADAVLHELRSYVKPAYFTAAVPTAPTDTTDPAHPIAWHLPGDSCPSCWALDVGTHDGTQAMPASCRAAPFNGTLSYTVTVNGQDVRSVTADVTWHSNTR